MPTVEDTRSRNRFQEESEILSVLRSIDDKLGRLVSIRADESGSREDRAILLIGRIGPNASKIAATLGVSRRTVYGWPRFVAALKMNRLSTAGAAVGRSGYKSSGGDLDAWEG